MLHEYSHIKSESLAEIRATVTEIQNFSRGLFFYWHTLYM